MCCRYAMLFVYCAYCRRQNIISVLAKALGLKNNWIKYFSQCQVTHNRTRFRGRYIFCRYGFADSFSHHFGLCFLWPALCVANKYRCTSKAITYPGQPPTNREKNMVGVTFRIARAPNMYFSIHRPRQGERRLCSQRSGFVMMNPVWVLCYQSPRRFGTTLLSAHSR